MLWVVSTWASAPSREHFPIASQCTGSEKGNLGPVLVAFRSLDSGEEAAPSLWLHLLRLCVLPSSLVLAEACDVVDRILTSAMLSCFGAAWLILGDFQIFFFKSWASCLSSNGTLSCQPSHVPLRSQEMESFT